MFKRGQGDDDDRAHGRARRRKFSVVLVCFLGAGNGALGQVVDPEHGRAIAERECARCHAILRTGQSPHLKAPPFRELPKRYPVEHLAESLVEGIVVGHGDMPEFIFEPDEVGALLAYIASLAK